MSNSIEIRQARLDDKEAVVAFCQNTFSWGDYIAEAFDRWTQDPNGKLLVATIDGQPIGLLRTTFLGNGVAWMEGMRVHPDFRRRGIGTRLDTKARQLAREYECRVAQLVTSMKNIAAQYTLDTEGYRRVAQFNEWETEPLRENSSALRTGTANDIRKILAQWETSEMFQASHAVVPDCHWHWSSLEERRLREHIHANEARIVSNGFAIVAAFDEPDWNGLNILALAGDAESIYAIAHAVRYEAAYRGYAHVEANVADCAPLNTALERAGFQVSGGTFLYEQTL